VSVPLRLTVNGQPHTLDVAPDTPLLYVLRNDLGLKAAKFGCGLEQCGACKVLIDGVALPSCATPVSQVQDAKITTVEGLGTAQAPHPLQRAFIAEQAAQCGYCTAGLLIAAQGLLSQNPDPTRQEICQALEVHICRCGSHNRIIRAIQRAAREMAV
jgi:nicotinate dehydrogenase subunit A